MYLIFEYIEIHFYFTSNTYFWYKGVPAQYDFWELEKIALRGDHNSGTAKVQRADLTGDIIRKVAPFVLNKL